MTNTETNAKTNDEQICIGRHQFLPIDELLTAGNVIYSLEHAANEFRTYVFRCGQEFSHYDQSEKLEVIDDLTPTINALVAKIVEVKWEVHRLVSATHFELNTQS